MTRGKYGRLPARPGWEGKARASALLGALRAAGITIPRMSDQLKAIADRLLMLGNDTKGDCVAVMIANMIFVLTGKYPELDAVLEFYASQNPKGTDNGMVIELALKYLRDVGMRMPDGSYKKCIFYAAVDVSNADDVEEMLALFGVGGYGIVVTDHNEDQFDEGAVWTWATGDEDAGGHGVCGGGYDADKGRRDFATWAAEAQWDATFDGHQVEELWVVLFEEHRIFLPDVALDAAGKEFTRVTGKSWPFAPVPPPVASAVSVILSSTDAAFLDHWSQQEHEFRNNKKAAGIWRTARDL